MSNIYTCMSQNVVSISEGSDYADIIALVQEDGSPYDLTGCTLRSQLRGTDGALVADFECQVDDAAGGVVRRSLQAQATTLVPRAVYVWGLRVITPDGMILPEVQGGAKVVARVVQ